MTALQPIYNSAIAYKQGGLISVASNTTLSISSVLTRSRSDDADINIGDYFGAAISTTLNAATTGFNALDTGTLAASKVYAVYAISDQAKYNASGFILSLSTTSPVMPKGIYPSGYNTFVRIGWAVTDASSHFLVLNCSGTLGTVQYTYDTPIAVLSGGNAVVQTVIDVSSVVPAVSYMPVKFARSIIGGQPANTGKMCSSGGTIASSRNTITQIAVGSVPTDVVEIPVALISGLPKVDYIVSNAGASLTVYVNGFTDYVA